MFTAAKKEQVNRSARTMPALLAVRRRSNEKSQQKGELGVGTSPVPPVPPKKFRHKARMQLTLLKCATKMVALLFCCVLAPGHCGSLQDSFRKECAFLGLVWDCKSY